jgi:hypothetical protein
MPGSLVPDCPQMLLDPAHQLSFAVGFHSGPFVISTPASA